MAEARGADGASRIPPRYGGIDAHPRRPDPDLGRQPARPQPNLLPRPPQQPDQPHRGPGIDGRQPADKFGNPVGAPPSRTAANAAARYTPTREPCTTQRGRGEGRRCYLSCWPRCVPMRRSPMRNSTTPRSSLGRRCYGRSVESSPTSGSSATTLSCSRQSIGLASAAGTRSGDHDLNQLAVQWWAASSWAATQPALEDGYAARATGRGRPPVVLDALAACQ
jgi:hypothetical protein